MTEGSKNGSKTIRHRNWMVTSFVVENYIEWQKLSCNDDGIRYFVYQLEKCPETGKEHIQGYIELNIKCSMKRLKKLLNDNTIHCETRRGTQDEAIKYCSKNDTRVKDTIYIGSKANQGQRNDLNAIYDMIANGSSLNDIIDEFPNQYVRYNRGIEKLYENIRNRDIPHFKEVTTSILYGDAGTGKTKLVYDRHNESDVYRLRLTNNGIWFDGYNGQKVLLIDDFYGSIKFHDMLEYMDGYKFQVPIKGGFVYKAWDKVYITSNKHPNDWYEKYKCMEEPAFKRRVTELIYFERSVESDIKEPVYYTMKGSELKVTGKLCSKKCPIVNSYDDEIDKVHEPESINRVKRPIYGAVSKTDIPNYRPILDYLMKDSLDKC